MTTEDEAKAKTIVESWYWQMAEGHNFRWKSATKSMTLFYESAPLESDVAQLVIEYLKSREGVTEFVITNKKWTFDKPWNAKDCWYQTVPSEKWAGTESTKVRVYWALVQNGDEAADGPYTVENGCKYKVSHSYYWDVASEPTLPASSSGVQYSIQGFTRDRETGLFTYIIEKRETVQQDVALYDTAVTAFELSQEEQHLGVKADKVATTGKKASVKNGVITERHVTKNPDCTSDIVNRVTTEKNVKGAVKTWRKTLRGTVESTTERSAANPLNGSGLQVGETRRSEQTPGELWNNTVEKTTNEPVGEIASECQKTIFEHRDVTVQNVASKPSGEAQEAGGGKTRRRSVRKTDENTFDVTDEETTEKKVANARTSRRRTLRGTTETTTHRNLTPSEAAAAESGELKVGETVSVEKTDGDSRNVTVEKFTADKTRRKLGGECQKTASVHTDTEIHQVPASEAEPGHATSGVNEERHVSFRLNDDGQTADKTTLTRTWTEATARASGGSAGHTDTVESGINATGAPSEQGGVNEEVDVSVQPNDHGSVSYTKRRRTYKPNTQTASANDGGRTVTVTSGINATSAPSESGGTNTSCDVSVSPNEHGSLSYTTRRTTYKTSSARATSKFKTETATTTTAIYDTGEASARNGTASATPNGVGSKTTQVTEYDPKPVDSGWITWMSEEDSPTHTYIYECGLRVFKNVSQPPSPPGGKRVSISASINRYGLYDGSMTCSKLARWKIKTSSDTGGSQAGSIAYEYIADYNISTTSNGQLTITPVIKTRTISTRTYYGRGNEGSEAAAAANSQTLPGLHLSARTYITGGASGIVSEIEKARTKLTAALHNHRPAST